ncbi:hypothetical protein M0805_005114 [Coniferiporia weirii]|nr:hypothetical protein M0805_005114 [Coniferiporia weirii]
MGDLSRKKPDLQETLEAEFCPPLETTLVAAFLADFFADSSGVPADEALQTLRDLLGLLAASAAADQDDLASDLVDLQLFAHSTATDDSRDSDSVFDNFGEASSSSGSSAPPHSWTSPAQLNSALAFLRASFPHLPALALKERLEYEQLSGEMDMERIVGELLTEDYLKELEERGLEDDETLEEEIEKWQTVSRKCQSTKANAPLAVTGSKKKKAKGRTIAVNDVRQKQHVRPVAQAYRARSAGDPWDQIVSIATYLESLLLRPASFFLSYFHKPDYATPSGALRAALDSIHKQDKAPVDEEDQSVALLTLLEFIRASPDYNFDSLDSEARAFLISDAELSLVATGGSPDVAFDIVRLLHEMEADNDGMQEMGVYHSPTSPLSVFIPATTPNGNLKSPSEISSTTWATVPESLTSPRTAVFIPPATVPKPRPPPAPSQNTWQVVKPARPKAPAMDPLAEFIPSYNRNNVPRRKAQSASGPGASPSTKGGRRAGVMGDYKGRIDACRARRNEALRTASRHWAGGSARTRGGEVALFYALEAQRHQAEARRLQLDAARELVEGKRFTTANHDTIDLHYCTVTEALALVREVLDEGWASPARPLHVITGRGTHSTGGVAVLGPALKNALERDGWSVGRRGEAGLLVKGQAYR